MKAVFKYILTVGVMMPCVSFASPAPSAFCGQIKELFFKEYGGRITAYGLLTSLEALPDHRQMEIKKLIVVDPKAIYKLAKVVSKTSVQDSKKLLKDLEASQFEWDSLIGSEEHPRAYEEDYQVCLSAHLDQLDKNKNLHEVIEILDVLEDGYSIKDLLD